MIDLGIVSDLAYLTKEERAKLHQQTMEMVEDEGRSARAIGMRYKDCPPFRDPNMEVAWKAGWLRENLKRFPGRLSK